MGGDSVQSINSRISLNGKMLKEPYVKHIGHAFGWMMNFGPTLIPPDKLFVMGDNRDVSLDSRAAEFGLVDQSVVTGKVLYILKAGRAGKAVR